MKLPNVNCRSQLLQTPSPTCNQPPFPPLNISSLIQKLQKPVHPMRLTPTQRAQESTAKQTHGAHDNSRGCAPWAAGRSGLLRGLLVRHLVVEVKVLGDEGEGWETAKFGWDGQFGMLGVMGMGVSVAALGPRATRRSHVWRARGFRGSDVGVCPCHFLVLYHWFCLIVVLETLGLG